MTETLRLYHAFMYPGARDDRTAEGWISDRLEHGILSRAAAEGDGDPDPRHRYVYLYDPAETVPVEGMPGWPNLAVEVPRERVRVAEYGDWDVFDPDWPEEWEENLEPYGADVAEPEYVVRDRVPPDRIVEVHRGGLPEAYVPAD